jgi:hypothetical protein
MPTLSVRKSSEAPPPSRVTKAVRERQLQYENFVKGIGDNVGELEMAEGDKVRSVKVSLRRAATRTGIAIDMWDANDRVYFKRAAPKRGRPKKS